jgi:hypothetical protein
LAPSLSFPALISPPALLDAVLLVASCSAFTLLLPASRIKLPVRFCMSLAYLTITCSTTQRSVERRSIWHRPRRSLAPSSEPPILLIFSFRFPKTPRIRSAVVHSRWPSRAVHLITRTAQSLAPRQVLAWTLTVQAPAWSLGPDPPSTARAWLHTGPTRIFPVTLFRVPSTRTYIGAPMQELTAAPPKKETFNPNLFFPSTFYGPRYVP